MNYQFSQLSVFDVCQELEVEKNLIIQNSSWNVYSAENVILPNSSRNDQTIIVCP